METQRPLGFGAAISGSSRAHLGVDSVRGGIPHWKNWHATHQAELTIGQRIADAVAAHVGSWQFIIFQSIILAVWIVLNVIVWLKHWDPYPFILLNLALSFQAAYAAPFIMISQNRQAERDRHQAEEDFRTNVEAERRIEELQTQLTAIEFNKLDRIIELLEKHSMQASH